MFDQTIRGAQTGQFVIKPGEYLPINSAGEFVRCLAATDIFKVSVNGGSAMFFAEGIEYVTPPMVEYQGFELINETASDITVLMAWGFGEFHDNRLTASGDLKVVNAAGQTLKVDDDQTQAALATLNGKTDTVKAAVDLAKLAVDAVTAALVNANSKRNALTPLSGAQYHVNAGGGTVEVVTAAANVNGILIRYAHCPGVHSSGNQQSNVRANGAYLLEGAAGPDKLSATSVRDLVLSPGINLTTHSSGLSASAYVFYQLL